jgi:prevent-host-death family protein
MLEVDIEKIIPVTDARDSLNQIIETVEGSDSMYVITKNGKPSAIIVGVHHLEKLTGMKTDDISVDEEQVPAEVAPVTEVTPIAEATPAPFTMAPAEDDVFAPLPDSTISAAPATVVETPVDLSQASAPAAPAIPPAQAPTDQV